MAYDNQHTPAVASRRAQVEERRCDFCGGAMGPGAVPGHCVCDRCGAISRNIAHARNDQRVCSAQNSA